MENFSIHAYRKKELAILYFPNNDPHTAVKNFMRLIRRCDMLWDALLASGYQPYNKTFTPRQVALVVEWIGAPADAGA